jgi:predicted 3-demethylubiquinone-9 3-methyltransferase (glyoxalase superfamily)
MQKITPFLWFDGQAEEAAHFYGTVFKDSKITNISRHGAQVMSVSFTLNGQDFLALNGGPMFKFTEAISFFVNCKTQEEVDYYWDNLTRGGQESRCGWLKDKFGLSWQIIPSALGELMGDKDPARAGRVAQAMMKMNKINIQALKDAHEGK